MLKEKIQADLNESIKSNNKSIRDTLRMLLAGVINKEKDKRYKVKKEKPNISEEELDKKASLTDEELIEVVSSENKKRKEAVFEYEKGERQELADKEKAEMEVLQKYLPEQVSEEELRKLVKEVIDKTGAKEMKDMGKIMAELMPKVKGRADGNEVSKIVKELL